VSVSGEDSAVGATVSPPDPTSRDYTVVTQSTRANTITFNGTVRQTLRTIRISGYRVAIEAGGRQGLVERLMPGGAPAGDIELVEIFAREVVVGVPLRIPGASINIYAHSLSFQDHGSQPSLIDITPLGQIPETTPGKDGAAGQNSGRIHLYITQIENAAPSPTVRLIFSGGPGQQGGPQSNGQDGGNKPEMPNEPQIGGIVRSWHDLQPFVIVDNGPLPTDWSHYDTPKHVVWFYRYDHADEWGVRNTWPGDGTDGTPGGRAGLGGSGGSLHSAIPVDDTLLVRTGGISADARPQTIGGNPGNPQTSVGVHIENHRLGFALISYCHFFVHKAQPGHPISSPPATSPRGPDGTKINDLHGWLHPAAATAILGFAEDVYRIGLLSRADQELQFLQTALNSSDQLTEDAASYEATRQRVDALRARISSNLDYFGNPGGWTSPLNLAATLQLLQNELAASSRILVTTELVRLDAEQAKAKGNTLITSRDATSASITKLSEQLDALAVSIPDLQREAATVAATEQDFYNACKQREDILRQTAVDLANPKTSFLSGALKTLGAIAKVCPIGQPIVGAVGGGLDILSNIGQDSPWDLISQIPSVASQFSSANIKTSVDSYKSTVSAIAAMDPSNPRQFFGDVQDAAKAIGKSMADFKKMQDSARAPQSKVDAILQQLKATDASLADLTNQASALTAKKAILSAKIDKAIHDVGEYTSQVGTMTDHLDTLNRDITQAEDLVDHPAVIAANEIGRALRERLDYYHYLMIKAYEYFAAAPYQGNRRAAGTADSLLQFINQASNDPTAAAQAFEAAYMEEIRAVGRDIVQLLIGEGDRNQKVINVELSADERAALNQMTNAGGGSDDLFISLENRRRCPVKRAGSAAGKGRSYAVPMLAGGWRKSGKRNHSFRRDREPGRNDPD
jgi:predicted transcriptional regulator